MSYTKTEWTDYTTVIDADKLNNMEDGIEAANDKLDGVQITEAASLNNIADNDPYETLLGKIKKAISSLISHLSGGDAAGVKNAHSHHPIISGTADDKPLLELKYEGLTDDKNRIGFHNSGSNRGIWISGWDTSGGGDNWLLRNKLDSNHCFLGSANHQVSMYGQVFASNASTDPINTGTVGASHGGTGQTTLGASAKALLNAVSSSTSAISSSDKVVVVASNGNVTQRNLKAGYSSAEITSSNRSTYIDSLPSYCTFRYGRISYSADEVHFTASITYSGTVNGNSNFQTTGGGTLCVMKSAYGFNQVATNLHGMGITNTGVPCVIYGVANSNSINFRPATTISGETTILFDVTYNRG